MKQFVIAFLCMVHLTTFTHIVYDSNWDRLSTYPYSNNINNKQYEKLFVQLVQRVLDCPSKEGSNHLKNSIIDYLTTLNTPTSLRLLSDMGGEEFNPKHLELFIIGIMFSHGKNAANYIKDLECSLKSLTKVEFSQYIVSMKQIGIIVLMCWSSGVFGVKVDNQIKNYLKNQGAKIPKILYVNWGFEKL